MHYEPHGLTAGTTPAPASAAVYLSVVAGQPTATEIAAVVAVLAARARGGTTPADGRAPAPASRRGWSERSRSLRAPIVARPGGWRASARPG
jgi:hypothetical protein